jgi:putative transposase
VTELRDRFPLQLRGDGVGRAPSSFSSQPEPRDDLALRSAIETIAAEYPRYGYRRVAAALRRRGWGVNHTGVLRVMREANLLVALKRSCRTTDSAHHDGRSPTLLREREVVRPDQVWCADVTDLRLRDAFIALAVVLDSFTGSVRGWELGRDLSATLTVPALAHALERRQPSMHHSDQGGQCAATVYVERLHAAGVPIRMAARGRPTANGFAERMMRTLKEEDVASTRIAISARRAPASATSWTTCPCTSACTRPWAIFCLLSLRLRGRRSSERRCSSSSTEHVEAGTSRRFAVESTIHRFI